MSVIQDIKTIMGKKPTPQAKPSGPEQIVLIVEDDVIIREMYQDKFTKEGFSVVTAENGKVGMEKLLEKRPNIIILDLMMPVMDGKAILRKFREFPQFKR